MGRHVKKTTEQPKQSTKEKLRVIKKERKQKLKEKRARLIIRNLPFTTTQENLKEHFEKFGEIEDVMILKNEDGKLKGCGFVQFKLVQKAAKARHHTNGKPFLGRDLDVDFAKAKDTYEKFVEVKTEPLDESEVKVKDEPIDADQFDASISEVKDEIKIDVGSNIGSDDENSDKEEEEETSDEEETGDEEEEEISDSDESDEIIPIEEPAEKKPRVVSNDVAEGKTIFVKNVPFTATNADLKQCMLQFGRVYYALICIDKLTERSKGTGFVKFVVKEDAEKALSAGTELTLLGNILDCHPALNQSEANQKAGQNGKKDHAKDNRNLYLVKEGVILASTKAAENVSSSDMAKRLQLEQYKTQMLRNLNMFVSRERLVVHNLPLSWDDKKLRTLFQKYSNKSAVIKEARIIRNLKEVNENGIGLSKQFGFVTFTRHEDALFALRALNNNPNIFSPQKRPIITFSIENRSAMKTKQRRLEKSRIKNPNCKDFDSKPKKINKNNRPINNRSGNLDTEEQQKFAGVNAKPGVQKMRSRHNLKTQAILHRENLKSQKKKDKVTKRKSLDEKRQDVAKQPKQKMKKKRDQEDENFTKMINSYKKRLTAPSSEKTSKWYE